MSPRGHALTPRRVVLPGATEREIVAAIRRVLLGYGRYRPPAEQ